MKTIQSNSAQKANMRSARKSTKTTTTPSSDRQRNEKESSAGKKLVQARLPFKIIAGTLPIKPHEDAVTSSKIDVPSKKRKLSFTEEPENQKKIGKSQSKENLTIIDKTEQASSTIDVIVLEDEVSEEEPSPSVSPKTPATSGTTLKKKKNKNTPNNAGSNGSSTTPKLQIKLPLSGKKKRKTKRGSQSITKPEEGSDSTDVEFLPDEQQQNPPKKQKLEELPKQLVEDVAKKHELSQDDIVEAQPKKDVSQKKNTKTSQKPNSPSQNETLSKENEDKEKQSDEPTQPEPQTPKTSKPTRSNLKKTETPEVESSKIDTRQAKNSPKPSKISKSKTPQKLESPSKKIEIDKNSTQEEAPERSTCQKNEESNSKMENSPKDTSVRVEDMSPTKNTRSSRRSVRISETERNKKEADDVSSEPEFVSETPITADTSFNKEAQNKLLTPKQQKLNEQRRKAREEKELKWQQLKEEKERKLQEQREERERKVQEEKNQKQKEREERELQRKKEREEKEEQKRREREEKEDQRRKEKEDKERKRLAEIEVKNEEKRKKDEAKEEERRKKEEDRRRKELEKEEEENKKKKAAQAFTKFFVPKPSKPITDEDQESREDAESVDSLAFRPFQVKGDMKLAPLVRREYNERSREKLDSFLKSTQSHKSALYIGQLKNGTHTPLRGFKTVLKNNDDEDDVILIASELENAAQTIDEPRIIPIQKYKAKYYFFRENRRPPFYGTWRKKSTVITPRRPFATDKGFFDYEVDSDDEWEEEEPGESLNGSEDEKDESEDEDYEVDNEWFVPHGHLSDEELQNEDEIGPDTSREAQKAKLKALQQEFAQEMKKKTEKIKPRLIGAIWEDENGNRPKLCPAIIWDSLCTRAMMFSESPLIEAPEAAEPEPSTPPPEKRKRIEINDDLLKDLVRLVHGNRHSRVFLIKEYMEHVSNTCETVKSGECLAPTKSQIKEKIDEISEWSVVDAVNKKNKNKKKLCWVVAADVLDKYSLGNLGLRNEWSYKLQPKFDKDKIDQNAVNETEDESIKPESSEHSKTVKNEKKKSKPAGITKFTKVISKDEKKTQLTDTESASPKATSKGSPKVSKISPSPKVKEPHKATTPAFKKPAPPVTAANKTPVVKKRVALLMSVPTGQEFSPQSKNALISKFLQKNKTAASAAKSIEVEKSSKVPISSVTTMDVDEVVVLD